MPKLQKNIVWTLLHAFWIYRWTISGDELGHLDGEDKEL